MDKFQVGKTYGVLHSDDGVDAVEIASRDGRQITLSDGRRANVLDGIGPNGGSEEVFRLGEVGAVATGGVVRACHLKDARAIEAHHGITATAKGE